LTRLLETAKFKKQREKLRSEMDRQALKKSITEVMENPLAGKKLKGELSSFRSLRFSAPARGSINHEGGRGKCIDNYLKDINWDW